MFPYPSGKLHIGHIRNYAITDAIAKYKKQQGFNTFQPMGWDAFGLPAENAARDRNIHPQAWTNQNIAQMKEQVQKMNFDINWDTEINTSSPEYYRWTQWLFIQMYKRGLAYQKESTVNWDPIDETVLANEQIDANGKSWRSGAIAQQREMKQWFFKITEYADELRRGLESMPGWGKNVKTMQFNWIENMRDWGISRQRYWGTPIPMIHCPNCGTFHEDESNLPIKFPHREDVTWNDYNQVIDKWKQIRCPKCGGNATRETDTMDTFVDSSWYYFRYIDAHNHEQIFDPEKINQWMPSTVYVGGIEHAIMHLLYSRFIHKVIRDMGLVACDEPFENLITQGMVKGKTFKHKKTGKYTPASEIVNEAEYDITWEKMSKSKYNGIDPQSMIEKYGADAMKAFVITKAPIEKDMDWDETGIRGARRFIDKVNNMNYSNSENIDISFIDKIEKFTKDYNQEMEQYKFHTAWAKINTFANEIKKAPDSKEKDLAVVAIKMAIKCFV
jgi:leucyl-tRNA synthetase